MIVLLPIFLIGMFPMLLMALLGFAGLALFGVLLICVGLSDALRANSDFNQEIIAHGYSPRSERAADASKLHSTVRFAIQIMAIGASLVVAGIVGFVYSG